MNTPLCVLKEVDAGYGDARVLFQVSLQITAGACVAILGRNGAGKTTTMRAVLGLARVTSGEITWKGQPLRGRTSDAIARLGLALVPEDRRIFSQLTVLENLQVAERRGSGGLHWDLERVLALFPELKPHLARQGGYLSGGQQQMLTIARALMTNPELLLLDEPSEGLAPVIVDRLLEAIQSLKAAGMTIVLAEQNLWFCLEIADIVNVMDRGRIRFEGTPAAFRADPTIAERYLTV